MASAPPTTPDKGAYRRTRRGRRRRVAAALDFNADIASRLPLMISGVVVLSVLLLLIAFRSIAIAGKAALLNLLSIGAAYGVIAVVLQGGWAGELVGIDTPTPLPAYVPVLVFTILFGLSMDYEVFLLGRMHEHYVRTGDSDASVTVGLASTAKVITTAAAIMVVVFRLLRPQHHAHAQAHRHRPRDGHRRGRHRRPHAPRPRHPAATRPVRLVASYPP